MYSLAVQGISVQGFHKMVVANGVRLATQL